MFIVLYYPKGLDLGIKKGLLQIYYTISQEKTTISCQEVGQVGVFMTSLEEWHILVLIFSIFQNMYEVYKQQSVFREFGI